MKNANQIRHLLKRMLAFSNVRPRTGTDAVFAGLTREALALLPCETCGGEGNIGGSGYEDEQGNYVETETVSCPDCQPKPKQEESSPSTMWEHLH